MIKVDNIVMPIDHDETQDPRTLGGTEDGAIGQGTINMTMITLHKANGKWRMSADLTNLTKACPKGNFSLPRIDQLVDSIAGCELLSFLDACSGYHQISMAKEDEKKTALIMPFVVFCYTKMPFGFINARNTF